MTAHPLDRRAFLTTLAALPFAAPFVLAHQGASAPAPRTAAKIKTSCNLYSFNAPLTSGAMTLEQVLEFCAEVGFEAVDPTGYYFTGYPAPPPDAEVLRIKHRAFRLGLDISGTGVRNDFAVADAAKRAADVAHVGRWVDVAARLGAPVLRVFAGRELPAGVTPAQAFDWVVEGLEGCIAHGARGGVMITLQNHDDVFKTAEETLAIRRRIPSEWFGLNVDIGSLRTTDDPYAEIAALAPYAYTWQVKELVYRKGRPEKVDLGAIVRILRDTGYRGYVPIETLGEGDPRLKVRRFFDEFRDALA